METHHLQSEDLAARLRVKTYGRGECLGALRGERIPQALGLRLLRLCAVRGIRYHEGFGEELRGVHPLFTRALNARSIMSGTIPDLHAARPEEIPYCFWYPEVPSEAACRQLVRRYPQMSYQVGRACAVAGYLDLYRELDILPEVHIAEEARESGHLALYHEIMEAPARYNVMDDYSRTVNADSPRPGFLNGDTAVVSSLEIKQGFQAAESPDWEDSDDSDDVYLINSSGYRDNIFNITEDMNIGEADIDEPLKDPDMLIQLLSTPLPAELPTMDKDILILAAAYYGNIERYSRLRRPMFLRQELSCCVRGIYHNTMFGLWWVTELEKQPRAYAGLHLQQAIHARFIMNNVLSSVADPKCRDPDLPYLIWYPTIAQASTYEALARLKPQMKPQILRACIVANYESLFDELLPSMHPDRALELEAKASTNPHFLESLTRRAEETGGFNEAKPHWKIGSWRSMDLTDNSNWVPWSMDTGLIGVNFESLYNGKQCSFQSVNLMACLPRGWRREITERERENVELNYTDWPPGWPPSSGAGVAE